MSTSLSRTGTEPDPIDCAEADAHEQLAYQERRNAGTTIARLRRTV